jgi:hypothetical protein
MIAESTSQGTPVCSEAPSSASMLSGGTVIAWVAAM